MPPKGKVPAKARASKTAESTAASSRPRRGKTEPAKEAKGTDLLDDDAGEEGRKKRRFPGAEDDDGDVGLDRPSKALKPDDGSDPDAPAEDGWPDRTVLAEAHIDEPCTYEGAERTLRAELQVHSDPQGLKSRLGYRVRLSLVEQAEEAADPKGKKKAKALAAEPTLTQIGYIHAWRIDQPPTKSSVHSELLTLNIHAADDANVKETAILMQAMYYKNGKVKKKFQKHAERLEKHPLLFVEMIHTFPAFQRRGFLTPSLQAFHRVLGHDNLPEWFRFRGSVVLVPGPPDGSRGKSWGKMRDEDVEKKLTGVYARDGGYEVWARNATVAETYIVVMGKSVPDADAQDVAGGDTNAGESDEGEENNTGEEDDEV